MTILYSNREYLAKTGVIPISRYCRISMEIHARQQILRPAICCLPDDITQKLDHLSRSFFMNKRTRNTGCNNGNKPFIVVFFGKNVRDAQILHASSNPQIVATVALWFRNNPEASDAGILNGSPVQNTFRVIDVKFEEPKQAE